jgi:hypothetical protein
MRRLAAAVLTWACSTLAFANTLTTDFTDLWFNANESGWGANVAQQGDTLFVTLFIYGPQQAPTWYVAPSTALTGSSGNAATFSGPLYETTGPWFATDFNPASVTVTPVGWLTFSAAGVSSATLTYNVRGWEQTKAVVRQTWRGENLAGVYFGGRQGIWAGCGAGNGKVDSTATVAVTQQGDDVQIRDSGPRHSCNYSGKYTPTGRVGQIVGTAVCDDLISRYFIGYEIQVGIQYLTMRVQMQEIGTDCIFNGYSGGMRQLP